MYEIRYRRNGYNEAFYSKNLQEVKLKFNEWYNVEIKNPNKKTIKKPITVKEWIYTWLETYKKPYVGERTYKEIQLVTNKYIINKIGNKTLSSISNIDIQKVLNEAVYNGKPQNKVYTHIRSIFKVAKQNELIKTNPTLGVIFKKAKDNGANALDSEKREEFLGKIKGHQLEAYYKFVLYSGCRRAEALGVTKDDIKDGYVHIRGTKTDKSDRYIPYFEKLKEIVESIDDNILFPFTESTVTRHFKEFAPEHTLRDLRKTFATVCHEKGISPKVVQKWLGHSKMDMTMNVYTEVTKEFERVERMKIDPKTDPKI